MSTSNEFARMLYVYSRVRASKLTAVDLKKIAKKYSKSAGQMISDISEKLSVDVPEEVKAEEVGRILHIYGDRIPPTFRKLLGDSVCKLEAEYDASIDPKSPSFDPAVCLQSKRIITRVPVNGLRPYDNVSTAGHRTVTALKKRKASMLQAKAEHDLANPELVKKREENREASERAKQALKLHTAKLAARPHVFDIIAMRCRAYGSDKSRKLFEFDEDLVAHNTATAPSSSSTSSSASGDLQTSYEQSKAEDTVKGGVFDLLYRMYHARTERRVVVTVRDDHGLRGSITGNLAAYDHHFNLIFTEAHERYRLRTDLRGSAKGDNSDGSEEGEKEEDAAEIGGTGIVKGEGRSMVFPRERHLKQVYVRGDTVVMIRWE